MSKLTQTIQNSYTFKKIFWLYLGNRGAQNNFYKIYGRNTREKKSFWKFVKKELRRRREIKHHKKYLKDCEEKLIENLIKGNLGDIKFIESDYNDFMNKINVLNKNGWSMMGQIQQTPYEYWISGDFENTKISGTKFSATMKKTYE